MGVETVIPSVSSHVAQYSHDDEVDDLTITFSDGSTYIARNVPKATFRSMQTCESPGSFWRRHIKPRFMIERQ